MGKALILADIVFRPYYWLFAILLFIIGFLMFSRYVKFVVEQFDDDRLAFRGFGWLMLFVSMVILLMVHSPFYSTIAVALSILYGVLDSKMYNKKKLAREIQKETSRDG